MDILSDFSMKTIQSSQYATTTTTTTTFNTSYNKITKHRNRI